MKRLFANNAVTLLANALPAGATTLRVMANHGDMFPSPASGEIFTITLEDQAASIREIVHVTGRSGDNFTILRGQEGTTAKNWPAGSGNDTLVDHRVTAATLYYLKDELTQNPPVDLTQINQKISDLETAFVLLQQQVNDIEGFDPAAILAEIQQLKDDLAANNDYSNAGFPDIENFKQAIDFLLDSDFYTLLNQAITEIANRLLELEQNGNKYQNPDFPDLDTYDHALDYLLQGNVVSGGQMVDADVTVVASASHTTITLPTAYLENSTAVYVGGLRQKRGVDFTESAPMELRLAYRLTQEMIDAGQNVVVDYVVA